MRACGARSPHRRARNPRLVAETNAARCDRGSRRPATRGLDDNDAGAEGSTVGHGRPRCVRLQQPERRRGRWRRCVPREAAMVLAQADAVEPRSFRGDCLLAQRAHRFACITGRQVESEHHCPGTGTERSPPGRSAPSRRVPPARSRPLLRAGQGRRVLALASSFNAGMCRLGTSRTSARRRQGPGGSVNLCTSVGPSARPTWIPLTSMATKGISSRCRASRGPAGPWWPHSGAPWALRLPPPRCRRGRACSRRNGRSSCGLEHEEAELLDLDPRVGTISWTSCFEDSRSSWVKRDTARSQSISNASFIWPTARIAWWMRPPASRSGPRRTPGRGRRACCPSDADVLVADVRVSPRLLPPNPPRRRRAGCGHRVSVAR